MERQIALSIACHLWLFSADVPFPSTYRLHLNAFEKEDQLGPVDLDLWSDGSFALNAAKCADLESFMNQAKAVALPKQKFDLIAALIEKHENIAILNGHAELTFNDASQPIKAFPEVYGARSQEQSYVCGHSQHGVTPASSRSTIASVA